MWHTYVAATTLIQGIKESLHMEDMESEALLGTQCFHPIHCVAEISHLCVYYDSTYVGLSSTDKWIL